MVGFHGSLRRGFTRKQAFQLGRWTLALPGTDRMAQYYSCQYVDRSILVRYKSKLV